MTLNLASPRAGLFFFGPAERPCRAVAKPEAAMAKFREKAKAGKFLGSPDRPLHGIDKRR
jgi:hypothetical protein